jgi:hypothetical protein
MREPPSRGRKTALSVTAGEKRVAGDAWQEIWLPPSAIKTKLCNSIVEGRDHVLQHEEEQSCEGLRLTALLIWVCW